MARKQKTHEPDTRHESRNTLELPTVVQMHVDGETSHEIAKVTSLSRNGAGFTISRSCTVGHLVKLVIPMPTELRAYDQTEELYPVMGIVQHCHRVMNCDDASYSVGVALIGKTIPDSYTEDPDQNYRINGMSNDGLWTVTETASPFKGRKAPRFSVALDVTLTLIQRDRRLMDKETTVTRDIGVGGASVVSELNARIGDKIKFACPAFNFYAIARVRNRKKMRRQSPTLHLEFVEARFPVEKLPNTQFDEFEQLVATDQHDAPVATDPVDPPPVTGKVTDFEFERF